MEAADPRRQQDPAKIARNVALDDAEQRLDDPRSRPRARDGVGVGRTGGERRRRRRGHAGLVPNAFLGMILYMASAATPRRRRSVEQPAWQPQQVIEFLVTSYGGVSKVARALGVNESQPTRWRNSEELPGPEATSKMLALEAVLRRALTLWAPEAAVIWMESPNEFLEGARPVDVAVIRGASEALAALEAECGHDGFV
jgi:transposase-like protein